MSSAGRAVSTNGCVSNPKGRGTGLQSCVRQIRNSSLTGSYVMEMAEQQEPYESRGSRTDLGEPGGEIPPGHSTNPLNPFVQHCSPQCRLCEHLPCRSAEIATAPTISYRKR